MNRERLSWALKATLPHVGSATRTLDRVTVTDGYVWATDGYTLGLTSVDLPDCTLTAKEAAELMRWVRPTRVSEHEEEVVAKVVDAELHVGVLDVDGEFVDSAVFDLDSRPAVVSFADVNSLFDAACSLPDATSAGFAFRPSLFAKFDKAREADTDLLMMYPKEEKDGKGTACIITVGADFVGLIQSIRPSFAQVAPAERLWRFLVAKPEAA